MKIEKISAITLRVASMRTSVRFYRDVLGMEALYGGEDWQFSSLRANGAGDLILNLEPGRVATPWGRLIFYVPDADEFSSYLKAKGFQAESARDGSWGERYFHMPDPDGHELSVARPIR
jgi:catechol 2,3-dioxygenase-like lactoylglutathione lyase family enzyme